MTLGRLQLDRAASEDDLLTLVVDYARWQRWLVYHARPGRTAAGSWLTPMVGDRGFPDLVLARPPRIVFAELKTERGKLGKGQGPWLKALRPAAEVYLWRPSDWTDIRRILA